MNDDAHRAPPGPGEKTDLSPPPGLHPFERVGLSVPFLHRRSLRQPPLCAHCGREAVPSPALSCSYHLGEAPTTWQVFLEKLDPHRHTEDSHSIGFPLCAACRDGLRQLSRAKTIMVASGLLAVVMLGTGDLRLALWTAILGAILNVVSAPRALGARKWKQLGKIGRSVEVWGTAGDSIRILLRNSHFALRLCQLNGIAPMHVIEGNTVAAHLAEEPRLEVEDPESSPAGHDERITLKVPVRSFEWPPLCAQCGKDLDEQSLNPPGEKKLRDPNALARCASCAETTSGGAPKSEVLELVAFGLAALFLVPRLELGALLLLAPFFAYLLYRRYGSTLNAMLSTLFSMQPSDRASLMVLEDNSILMEKLDPSFAFQLCRRNSLGPEHVLIGQAVKQQLIEAAAEPTLEEGSAETQLAPLEKAEAGDIPRAPAAEIPPSPTSRSAAPASGALESWRAPGIAAARNRKQLQVVLAATASIVGAGLLLFSFVVVKSEDPGVDERLLACLAFLVGLPLSIASYFMWDNSRDEAHDDWRRIR